MRYGLMDAIRLGVLLAAMGFVTPTHATSVIAANAPNGVLLNAKANAAFIGGTSGTRVGDSDTQFATADPTATRPAPPTVVTATATVSPDAGAAKDTAQVTATSSFQYGSPVGVTGNDAWQFNLSGTVSAVDARLGSPATEPAAAMVDVKLSLQFYLDAGFGGTPAGTYVGDLNLPGLRSLAPGETLLTLTLAVNGAAPSLSLSAGDAGTVVALLAGNGYRLDVQYLATAPSGTDPPLALSYTAAFTASAPKPVPVPDAGLGLPPLTAGLLAWGRRRRSGPTG